LAALTGAGLDAERFTFFGFLPRKGRERTAALDAIVALPHTAVIYEAANRETLIITMSETPEAVENARAIAAVPGIDGVLVGSSDLTQAMGMPSQARVDAAIDKIIQGTRAEGKAVGVAGAGMTVNNIARYREFANRGVQILSANAADFVRQSGGDFLKALR